MLDRDHIFALDPDHHTDLPARNLDEASAGTPDIRAVEYLHDERMGPGHRLRRPNHFHQAGIVVLVPRIKLDTTTFFTDPLDGRGAFANYLALYGTLEKLSGNRGRNPPAHRYRGHQDARDSL